jgi:sugar/nucleoside kinase (ribokinase family)
MKQSAEFDLVGIGRAFVDIIAHVDDAFLKSHNLPKGRGVDVSSSDLIDIRADLDKVTFQPGGAASNAVAGVAALGGRAAFFGKLCDDVPGKFFRNAFDQSKVFFPTFSHPSAAGASSATCLILMTVDGSVTIVNNRGIADDLTRNDIDKDIIASSTTLYVIAEMLASVKSRDAVEYAIDIALHASTKVALALNNYYFDDAGYFKSSDFIFGNMSEFKHSFPDQDLKSLRDSDIVFIITDGANGAHIAGRGNYIFIPVPERFPNKRVENPSFVGAGDQFAAGFLFGYSKGLPIDYCGRLGADSASIVLQASGARPPSDLLDLAEKHLGLTR